MSDLVQTEMDRGLYPKREAMPSNYRALALAATADDVKRPPTEEDLGHVIIFGQLNEEGQ